MGSSFLRFGIGLIAWRLGNDGYNLAKPRTFAKKYGFAKRFAKFVVCLLARNKLWYSKNISKEK